MTTSYGEQLLPSGENMEICTGALDRAQMEEKLSSFGPQLVIDATHPYARLATENIRAACGFLNLPYIRVVRESCGEEKNGSEMAVVAGETAWPEITDITQKIGGQEEKPSADGSGQHGRGRKASWKNGRKHSCYHRKQGAGSAAGAARVCQAYFCKNPAAA